MTPTGTAVADTFDEQIRALQDQVSAYQTQAGQLRAQANSLNAQVTALAVQKQAIEAQIATNELKKQQLNGQMEQTSDQIAVQKDGLAKTLRSMYVESDISPLEMIASSRSISDFIDRQEYRNRIRGSIRESLTRMKGLQAHLTTQRQQVDHVLSDQKAMRAQLDNQEDQKGQLLAETQGQEATYQQFIRSQNIEINDLRAQQRAANARFIVGAAGSGPACGGGYPGVYCDAAMDTIVDNWGMFNRECVSYTAWKVASTGRYVPYGLGNANMWPASARAAGIPVDHTPRPGDIAIWDIGTFGHAMYVESVNSDGTINISQYNAGFDGTFSTNRVSASGLQFIHF